MPADIKEQTQNQGARIESTTDTLSQLFNERDREVRNHPVKEESGDQANRTEARGAAKAAKPIEAMEATKIAIPAEAAKRPDANPLEESKLKEEETALPKPAENLKGQDTQTDNSDKSNETQTQQPSEADILRQKLEKTEKNLAENQRYGRTNAQRLSTAVKAVQKFADDGVLSEEEAQALLGALRPNGDSGEEGGYAEAGLLQAGSSHHHPFAEIFKTANRELENIYKYTDDALLPDKVNAFDYFLSVGSPEEIGEVLEDLTVLMDDPVKMTKKMLSIGGRIYEESWKGIKEAGGIQNYLLKGQEELEKLQQKIDKLEKKLLQYEDFDMPRYRIDEMGESDGKPPVKDTMSALFAERDRGLRPQVSGFRSQESGKQP